jgi:hypothetical protein
MLPNGGAKREKRYIKSWLTPTISIWNLSICRTRRPAVDIMCSNKELILERGTRIRQFLGIAESQSGRISFPYSGGNDAFITFRSLGIKGDGRTLIESMKCARAMWAS